jgi:hypothetical protein
MTTRTQEQLDRLEAIRAELIEALQAAPEWKRGSPWHADRERALALVERQIMRLVLLN